MHFAAVCWLVTLKEDEWIILTAEWFLPNSFSDLNHANTCKCTVDNFSRSDLLQQFHCSARAYSAQQVQVALWLIQSGQSQFQMTTTTELSVMIMLWTVSGLSRTWSRAYFHVLVRCLTCFMPYARIHSQLHVKARKEWFKYGWLVNDAGYIFMIFQMPTCICEV